MQSCGLGFILEVLLAGEWYGQILKLEDHTGFKEENILGGHLDGGSEMPSDEARKDGDWSKPPCCQG